MRLDALPWEKLGHNMRYAKWSTFTVYELGPGRERPAIVYTIQPTNALGDECWFGLDALTAQAVLYHLLGTPDAT